MVKLCWQTLLLDISPPLLDLNLKKKISVSSYILRKENTNGKWASMGLQLHKQEFFSSREILQRNFAEKSCKDILLFFDNVILVKLPRRYWEFKLTLPFLHLLKQRVTMYSLILFKLKLLNPSPDRAFGSKIQTHPAHSPISHTSAQAIPCQGCPKNSPDQSPAPHTTAPVGGRRGHCQGRGWCGPFCKRHHSHLKCHGA